jgi:hypothetical protein
MVVVVRVTVKDDQDPNMKRPKARQQITQNLKLLNV